jgi:hypothetical protein
MVPASCLLFAALLTHPLEETDEKRCILNPTSAVKK